MAYQPLYHTVGCEETEKVLTSVSILGVRKAPDWLPQPPG
jgi:hypothetical protein